MRASLRIRCIAAAIASLVTAAPGQVTPREMTLSVDLTDAPRKLIHAVETLAVAPGPLTLVYPKWIPGEHGPTGPIEGMAGLTISAAAPGGAETPVKWERDPAEMYAFYVIVPHGTTQLRIAMDFLATAAPSGFSAGASTGENLALLSWNTVVLYPAGVKPLDLRVAPSVTLPAAWQFGTALTMVRTTVLGEKGLNTLAAFAPVTLEQLVDSPVLAGRYFKEIPLAPEVTPKHFLDIAADGPEELELSLEHQENFSRLVREASALYASHHYGSYHFLVTLSDSVAHFGLEHHESSDDRVAGKTFTDDTQFTLAGDLLPHEFTHSWNGKYRRPVGLATSDYQQPMLGSQLWVYEGLTQYLGDVLAARSGIWTPEQFRGMLALRAAYLDNRPGRTWRDLQDTATMAQVLYNVDTNQGWDNWRRNTDFYGEGELVWLDVDVTLRELSGGRKSLDDFVAAFESAGGSGTPSVLPYTFADVVAALKAVVPNDWDAFLQQRLESNGPHAPLGGIVKGGYKLTYEPKPTAWSTLADTQAGTVDFWYSVGLKVSAAAILQDVMKDGPAFKAGFGPGMRLVAVNGRGYTPALLRSAIAAAQGEGPNVELIVENAGFYKVLTIDWHGGERYPVLEPVAGVPDRLDEILKPRALR